MKQQIETLGRLANLRENQVQKVMGQINYQRNLCQRYRNNITGLTRLCSFTQPMTTPLQRDNQQAYKANLHRMLDLQQRELAQAELTLARIQTELISAMRSEKIIAQVLESKMGLWQQQLSQQEQKIQDGLAAQSWWRARA